MPDTVADEPRKENSVREQDWRKGKDATGYKAKTTGAIGMKQFEVKRKPCDLPEKVIPEKKAKVPPKNNKAENR